MRVRARAVLCGGCVYGIGGVRGEKGEWMVMFPGGGLRGDVWILVHGV